MDNIILDKFKKANLDNISNKAISLLTGYEYYAGVFYDKRFDEFFIGGFQAIVKYKNDSNIITLASYCITDFFGEGFVDLRYYRKMQEIDKVYISLKNDIISDCLETIKKIEDPDHAKAA